MFKGAKLKNTKFAIGVVIYTGTDSKIQQNGAVTRFKISRVEKKMHKMIIWLFIVQLVLSIVSVIISRIQGDFEGIEQEFDPENNFQKIIMTFLRYFVLLSTMVPLSLIVNIEMVRLGQSILTKANLDLANKEEGILCGVNTTTINEELGQVEYVLTDKTGTLTQNKMVLRGIHVGNKLFGGTFGKNESGETEFFKSKH